MTTCARSRRGGRRCSARSGPSNAKTFSEQTAYDKWFDRNADRETARNERIHGAVGVIPGPLWVVLLFSSLTIFVFMMFFADSAERWYVQALMPAAVVAVMSATLLLISFLDDPFRDGFGGLKPVAMERTLDLLEEERLALGQGAALPCDAQGRPVQEP